MGNKKYNLFEGIPMTTAYQAALEVKKQKIAAAVEQELQAVIQELKVQLDWSKEGSPLSDAQSETYQQLRTQEYTNTLFFATAEEKKFAEEMEEKDPDAWENRMSEKADINEELDDEANIIAASAMGDVNFELFKGFKFDLVIYSIQRDAETRRIQAVVDAEIEAQRAIFDAEKAEPPFTLPWTDEQCKEYRDTRMQELHLSAKYSTAFEKDIHDKLSPAEQKKYGAQLDIANGQYLALAKKSENMRNGIIVEGLTEKQIEEEDRFTKRDSSVLVALSNACKAKKLTLKNENKLAEVDSRTRSMATQIQMDKAIGAYQTKEYRPIEKEYTDRFNEAEAKFEKDLADVTSRIDYWDKTQRHIDEKKYPTKADESFAHALHKKDVEFDKLDPTHHNMKIVCDLTDAFTASLKAKGIVGDNWDIGSAFVTEGLAEKPVPLTELLEAKVEKGLSTGRILKNTYDDIKKYLDLVLMINTVILLPDQAGKQPVTLGADKSTEELVVKQTIVQAPPKELGLFSKAWDGICKIFKSRSSLGLQYDRDLAAYQATRPLSELCGKCQEQYKAMLESGQTYQSKFQEVDTQYHKVRQEMDGMHEQASREDALYEKPHTDLLVEQHDIKVAWDSLRKALDAEKAAKNDEVAERSMRLHRTDGTEPIEKLVELDKQYQSTIKKGTEALDTEWKTAVHTLAKERTVRQKAMADRTYKREDFERNPIEKSKEADKEKKAELTQPVKQKTEVKKENVAQIG